VQAGLGGGLARAELAAAVSLAGGLGTVGILPDPRAFKMELEQAVLGAQGKPVAANLLFPFLRRGHVEACVAARVPVVALFFGFDRRVVDALHSAGIFVMHQVGTVEQARRALADGADGLIAQGRGAGGHLLASEGLAEFLPKLLELGGDHLVIAAGGIHDRASAAATLSHGAHGVSVGTRFLLTHESHAHDAYKARLLAAEHTLVTMLFGLGWPALHRVVPNLATERWCARDELGPRFVRLANRATQSLAKLLPPRGVGSLVRRQKLEAPFYSPVALVRGMQEALVDLTPLYAGECVKKIDRLMSAAEVVREIAAGSA
jgi:NAD(P)H-dependent flavin oxidoreductase YrpB (nitropropane dioxygenase family)